MREVPAHVWVVRWSRWFEPSDPTTIGLDDGTQVGYYIAASPTTRGMYQSTAICQRRDSDHLKHLKRRNAFRSLWECLRG
jgi:hypothetical protein